MIKALAISSSMIVASAAGGIGLSQAHSHFTGLGSTFGGATFGPETVEVALLTPEAATNAAVVVPAVMAPVARIVAQTPSARPAYAAVPDVARLDLGESVAPAQIARPRPVVADTFVPTRPVTGHGYSAKAVVASAGGISPVPSFLIGVYR